MSVLYVSKASRVVAHRDKLAELARLVPLHVVVPRRWGRAPAEEADPRHPPVEELPALFHGHNHLHLYRQLGRILDRVRPALVHADEEPYSAVTLQVAFLCGRRGVPFVFFAWQNLDKRLPPPFGLLRRLVLSRAAGGVAGTVAAADVLERAGFHGPVAVVPQMGVDPERFRPDPEARACVRKRLGEPLGRPVGPGDVVVGYVGRLLPEKGVDVLLDAVSRVPGLVLMVVGDGPAGPALRARGRRVGLDDRVHFAGAVPSSEVPAWIAALDVLALPSRTTASWSEQFGRVLVEAMACEVPVVCSDSGEMVEVVGDVGVVVPEGDAEALAAALTRLAADPAERRRRGEAGRARAIERFSQAHVAKETVAFWRRLPGVRIP